LLASLPADDAERRLRAMERPALTPTTIHDLDGVLEQVALCRRDGWARSDEELEVGVRSMAVPVSNRAGATVAGLSISVRAERMSMSEFRDAFLPQLLKARDTLSARLHVE
ncbi:MAG: IclR family transcriptional regulator, partial [Comamonadaceae bacterium]